MPQALTPSPPPSTAQTGPLSADVAIIGGGVAGLWTAARLAGEGCSCVLVEREALGRGQSIASQGIIHGGIKYALGGRASRASAAIAGMPGAWREALAGRGGVDLSLARVLAESQVLWTTRGTLSRLMGLAASKAIRTGVDRVADADRPAALASTFGVDVYRVAEPVLDPRSVITALAGAAQGAGALVMRGEVVGIASETDGATITLAGGLQISSRACVLAAGEGNGPLLDLALSTSDGAARASGNTSPPAMQLRPLHMVMVRGPHLPAIFGHCVAGALSDKPRLTITSQADSAGRMVWYVGGAIAEDGVESTRDEQLAAARDELATCVPGVDLAGTAWATLRVNRAEGLTPDGRRPDEPVLRTVGAATLAVWPTKLAFAPLVATRILAALRERGLAPKAVSASEREALAASAAHLPPPVVADLPWEDPRPAWSTP